MPRISLTRACILVPAAAFLRRIGSPPGRLLVSSGLPERILDDPEGLVPTAGTVRFLDCAAKREGIEALGLLAGQERHVDVLGVLGRMLCASPTLGDALRVQIENHHAFSSHGRIWLRPSGDQLQLCQSFSSGFDDTWAQADHYLMMILVGLLRLGAGPEWRPAQVQFQTRERRTVRDVAALSNASIAFGQSISAITFPPELLRAPLRQPARARLPEQSLEAWRASAPSEDFVGAVGQVVKTLSSAGCPRVAQTAGALGTSTRTLQRRLAAGGVSHEALVERARLSTAATLLADTNTRILDVALDVGYADHAHFTRAFRRWTGTTPIAFRRARQTSAPPAEKPASRS